MASTIAAGTTSGTAIAIAGDTSGVLQLQTNGTTAAVTIDTNQRAAFVAGTDALPAITTTGDTNTGIFFPAADTIAFSEGGTESMRINSSGNLLIGTTTAGLKLTVQDGVTIVSGDQSTCRLVLQNTTSPGRTFSLVAGTVGVGNEDFTIYDNTASATRVTLKADGALLINKTSQAQSERFGITGNENQQCAVLVSPISGDYDMINFRNTNGQVGRIGCNGSATSYITSSDYRLKEDIEPMTGALAQVALLKPVTYKWKVDGSDGQGFIAHELQAVVPDAVTGVKDAVETYTDEDGNEQTRIKPQGIDTSFLVATLTAAIQELNAKVDAQAVRIAELEGAK
jgi:hypothetical protein